MVLTIEVYDKLGNKLESGSSYTRSYIEDLSKAVQVVNTQYYLDKVLVIKSDAHEWIHVINDVTRINQVCPGITG